MKHPVSTFLLLASLAASAGAEPTSNPVFLNYVRPYLGTLVFLAGDSTGGLCPVNFFSLDLSTASGKAMYAVALTALLSGKQVQLEMAGACGGGPAGSTSLQSIYILR